MPFFENRLGKLTVEPAHKTTLPSSAHFIEHVFDIRTRESTNHVIAACGTSVFFSKDLGETWISFDTSHLLEKQPIVRCFTLSNGNRLIQTAQPFCMFLVDHQFNNPQVCKTGNFMWHGTWSIDESNSGVIMYCEYHDKADSIAVWRSDDGGASWRDVLRCQSTTGPSPEIRHFHTCQADPFKKGRWIVSSGDTPEQSKIWISEDDGIMWKELPAPIFVGTGPVINNIRRVFRFTSIAFLPNFVLWPTDDTLSIGRAALVVANREAPHRLRIASMLGQNEMRAFVQIKPSIFLCISESKIDPSCAELFIVDQDFNAVEFLRIPNPTGQISALTKTLSSKAAYNGTFFSLDQSGFFGEDCRFARWTIDLYDLEIQKPSETVDKPDGTSLIRPPGSPVVESSAAKNEQTLDRAANYADEAHNRVGLEGMVVLEAGCHSGETAFAMARRHHCAVVGINYQKHDTWNNSSEYNVSFIEGDLSQPHPLLKENSFDRVISFSAWHRFRHPWSALRQCQKYLKPNGKMYLVTPLYRSGEASNLNRLLPERWPHLLFSPSEIKQRLNRSRLPEAFWCNKLTYQQYLFYFRKLGFYVTYESFNIDSFDHKTYNEYENQLELYPAWDLATNFFRVVLEFDSAMPKRAIVDPVYRLKNSEF